MRFFFLQSDMHDLAMRIAYPQETGQLKDVHLKLIMK